MNAHTTNYVCMYVSYIIYLRALMLTNFVC